MLRKSVLFALLVSTTVWGDLNRQSVRTIKVIPTITKSVAYGTGQQIGGIQTLTNAASSGGAGAFLQDITILDMSKQSQAIDILIFDSLPTVVSVDGGAVNLTSLNLAKSVGVITIATSDYKTTSGQAIANVGQIQKVFTPAPTPSGQGPQQTTLYAIPVIRGTSTYTDTHALSFIYKFLQF